uniref:Glycosyl transferase family 2 n=1 Tax=Mimivirus LCMiAC01 TaxID=2506608 RepID=A0A481Z1W7_9VIRU|nr:MAG: glycosyl transferase family 2 [Mimivirus LCMiAC01]
MNEKISIILPTRQRPHNIDRLWKSLMDTVDDPDNIEMCLYIDNDDNLTIDHMKNKYDNNQKIKYMIGERIVLSKMWNEAYKLATGNIIMLCGDDVIFRTKNWDTIIRNEFNKYIDKILLVFGDDGFQHEKMAILPFVHRKWIEISGFFIPPYFVSDYCDTWLNDVSIRINRRVYIPKIYTEHMHFVCGKAKIDQNTRDRQIRHRQKNPEHLYKTLINERIEQAQKLLDYINKMKEKEIICSNCDNDFTFYPYMDSNDGDVIHINGTIDELKKECIKKKGVGFNTNGWIKCKLKPKSQWTKWSDNKNNGLYVLNK